MKNNGKLLVKIPDEIRNRRFSREKERGHKAEEKARALGFYRVNRTTILTPVNDRFSAQASDLEVFKFGFAKPKNWRNVSTIEM